MPGKAVAVSDYSFKREDRLLLDTNVLLFVFGPNKPTDPKVTVYSQAIKKMIEAKSQMYIDVLVVSEFINRYARMKWNIINRDQAPKNFKKFRQSEDFKPIAKEVADATSRVLKHCKRINSGFEELEINTLIREYAQGESDFNDQVIAEICRR